MFHRLLTGSHNQPHAALVASQAAGPILIGLGHFLELTHSHTCMPGAAQTQSATSSLAPCPHCSITASALVLCMHPSPCSVCHASCGESMPACNLLVMFCAHVSDATLHHGALHMRFVASRCTWVWLWVDACSGCRCRVLACVSTSIIDHDHGEFSKDVDIPPSLPPFSRVG